MGIFIKVLDPAPSCVVVSRLDFDPEPPPPPPVCLNNIHDMSTLFPLEYCYVLLGIFCEGVNFAFFTVESDM